jgi:hypothetical protein
MTDSFVKKHIDAIRDARKSSEKLDFYAEMTAAAAKHQLNFHDLAAYGTSLLLVSLVELAKNEKASISEATAAALQVVSDMSQDPAKMIDLWTKS